jgi:isoleucyl-tRNA synthetase
MYMSQPSSSTPRTKSETALREEAILAFWDEHHTFEKSLAKASPKGEFVFYDGPPFATGLPHMGHLLGSSVKDVVGRYKTMQGYHVARTWGWDCHGLPIEHMVEKKLSLKTKKDIEVMGIDAFNAEAKSTVLAYVEDWKQYVERLGRWVDFDHSYKTMDNSYIESVWWALKKIHADKRLYEGKKVLMYCPHCETPLSKAEIAMDDSYKDVTDEAAFVKFKLKNSELGIADDTPTYIVAWTTTPWTLPGNVALAIHPNLTYALARVKPRLERFEEGEPVPIHKSQFIILLANKVEELGMKGYLLEMVKEIKGSDLIGLSYEPLYDIPKAKAVGSEKAWTVQAADFVTTEDGTGVVHIAPMYGEDDYMLGATHGLPVVPLLDATGTFNADAPELVRGMYYKKGGKYVLEDIERRGLLFATHNYTHSYPHCYRCGTALIYNALTSWFIDIQSVKQRLLDTNNDIAWYPDHLKEGRFKHIVEGAPDWTISRNRFWASPLPIWKHETTGAVTVLGSLAEVRAHTKRSGNRYLFIRHGQADNNLLGVVSSLPTNEHHLTDTGRTQITHAAESLRNQGVTKIITSPLMRTRESAEILADTLGIDRAQIVIEDRFKEWQLGVLEGTPITGLRECYPTHRDRFLRAPEGGESLTDMKRRIGAALYELEETYTNETILIVGHEYTTWLATCVAAGADTLASVEIRGTTEDFVKNGEVHVIDFVPLSHNVEFEIDLHRPYIDTLPLVAEDGARLIRIPEVVDCWVESGLMPLASSHVLGTSLAQPERYPGDFIAEYIAQTRTWFYYMHAMGVLLFDTPSFTHCVTTGTILAEDGSKMSKSKGNFTDPLVNLDRYGADALRLYMLGSVVMQSEDMSFRDEELKEVHNRFIGILWNTYKFYEMYVDSSLTHTSSNSPATNPLDVWVLARLDQTIVQMTTYLDTYDTIRAIRTAREFVTDLSTWYIRRSRDRFKSEDALDRTAAIATTRHVLTTLATLLAPLAPFIAERIYQGVGGSEESVHLAVWPTATGHDADVLTRMQETRALVSEALELRAQAGIKIRQPLQSLTIPSESGVYEALVLDELNTKQIIRGTTLYLDTVLTDTLKQEGDIREFIRSVQDARKKAGLLPQDRVTLLIATDDAGKEIVEGARTELLRVAGVTEVRYDAGTYAGVVTTHTGVIHFMITKQ